LFDRLVNLHKLDNLIWVWSTPPSPPGAGGTGPGQLADFYPGSEYVDVLGEDIYGEFKTSFYEDCWRWPPGSPLRWARPARSPAWPC